MKLNAAGGSALHKGKLLRCESPEEIKKECSVKTLEEAFVKIIEEYENKAAGDK